MASKRPESSDRRSVNQQNAKASTGPRTPAGKTRSAQNAIRHGAYSAAVLVLGESQADFSRLKSELQATLRPEGPLEDRLLNRIALLWWRLERAQRVEQESLEQSLAEACYEASGLAAELTRNNFGGLDHPAPEQNAPTQTAFHWKDGQKLERLVRYETQIERAFFRLLLELERCQEKRKAAGGPAGSSLPASLAMAGFVSANDHEASPSISSS